MPDIPAAVHPDCRNFVTVVETLLQRRRAAPAAVTSWQVDEWGPRNWTRTEFEDMVYSSYKPMRQGRVTRPPRREIVMDIADYLNCSLAERNQLLLAARATPEMPFLSGAQLAEALKAALEVVQDLPLPAIIINRDWRVHYLNQYTLDLNGISPADVLAIPQSKLNILHLLFDPELPLHRHLIQNQASWTRMVRQTIYGFKLANSICQFETWYQELIGQLVTLPEFEHHWRTVRADAPFAADPSTQTQHFSAVVEIGVTGRDAARRFVQLRPLLISVGYFQFDFPQIVAFLPVDDESRQILRDIGIPVPDRYGPA